MALDIRKANGNRQQNKKLENRRPWHFLGAHLTAAVILLSCRVEVSLQVSLQAFADIGEGLPSSPEVGNAFFKYVGAIIQKLFGIFICLCLRRR